MTKPYLIRASLILLCYKLPPLRIARGKVGEGAPILTFPRTRGKETEVRTNYVGLEKIDDGIWNVYFGPLKLGRLNEQHMRIEDEQGRLKRKNV